jgi:hypothetical protein
MAGLNRCIDKHRLMIPIVYLLTDESSRECRVWLNLTLLVTSNIFLDRYVARFLQISLHCIDFCDSTKKFSETDIFIILFFFIANLFVDMFFFSLDTRHSYGYQLCSSSRRLIRTMQTSYMSKTILYTFCVHLIYAIHKHSTVKPCYLEHL